jgi:hypothetical protein
MGFSPSLGLRNYPNEDEFIGIVVGAGHVFKNRYTDDSEIRNLMLQVELMSGVVDSCVAHGFKAPPGWLKLLYAARAEYKRIKSGEDPQSDESESEEVGGYPGCRIDPPEKQQEQKPTKSGGWLDSIVPDLK